MTFTASEAEQILRELWDDAHCVGGFLNDWERHQTIRDLKETYGEQSLVGWTLIGESSWSTYEENEVAYLFAKDEDQSLWILISGHNVMVGSYGEDFLRDIEPTDMNCWLGRVEACLIHEQNFQGC